MRRLGAWSAPVAAIAVLVLAALAALAYALGWHANVILAFGMLLVSIAALLTFTAVTSLDPKNRRAHDHDH